MELGERRQLSSGCLEGHQREDSSQYCPWPPVHQRPRGGGRGDGVAELRGRGVHVGQ